MAEHLRYLPNQLTQDPETECMVYSCPYHVGNTLRLHLENDSPLKTSEIQYVEVAILRMFEPFTLSCVMEVALNGDICSTETFVLKLYDFRYAADLREQDECQPWNSETRHGYEKFIRSGKMSEYLGPLESDQKECETQLRIMATEDDYESANAEEDRETENCKDDDGQEDSRQEDEEQKCKEKEAGDPELQIGKDDAWLFESCRNYLATETAAYKSLKDLQGWCIPKFYGSVHLNPFLKSSGGDLDHYSKIYGVLLEYVPGYTLGELDKWAPRFSWNRILEQAIETINVFPYYEIINDDVRPDNILVRKKDNEGEFDIVFIDFAMTERRKPEQSDQEWYMLQRGPDEEGALGQIMQRRLKGSYCYIPTHRFGEFSTEEETEKWRSEQEELWRVADGEDLFAAMAEKVRKSTLKAAEHWPETYGPDGTITKKARAVTEAGWKEDRAGDAYGAESCGGEPCGVEVCGGALRQRDTSSGAISRSSGSRDSNTETDSSDSRISAEDFVIVENECAMESKRHEGLVDID